MAFNVTLCGLLCCWIALFYPLSAAVALGVNYFFVKQDYGKEEVNPHDMHLEVLWDDEAWPVIFFWSKIGVVIFYFLCFGCILFIGCRSKKKTVIFVDRGGNNPTADV